MTDKITNIPLSPLKIIVCYIVFSCIWFILTGLAPEQWVSDTGYLSVLLGYKDGIYVIITATALFFLVKIYRNQLSSTPSFSADNINRQKPTEAEVREGRKLLVKTFQSLKECVIIHDAQSGVITNCNKETEKTFGYSRDELLNSTAQKLHINRKTYHRFREQALSSIKEKDVLQSEFEMKKKNGEHFYSDHTVTAVRDKSGDIDKFVSVIRNVTGKKKYQNKLEQRNTLIETTIENLPVGVAVGRLDDGKARMMNNQFSNIYGWPKEKLSDFDSFFDHIFPDRYSKENKNVFLKRLQNTDLNKIQLSGLHIRTQDDKKKIVNIQSIPIREQNLLISTVVDVTEQLGLEEMLKKQNRKLERVQQEAKIGYWEYAFSNDKPPVWSDNLYHIYGLNADEYSPTIDSFLDMFHPDDYYPFEELKEKVLKNESVEDTFRLIKPNGEVGYYYAKNELITDNKGEALKILGIVQDISDLKHTEKELKEERQRFKLVAETTGDVIWDLDIQNEELWWSKGFEEIFGYAREELKSNFDSWSDYIHPDDEAKVIQSSQEQLNSSSNQWEQEYRIIRKDGSIAHIIDRAAILRDSKGEAIRMVGITEDITDRKEAEKKLRESEEKYRHLFENNPEPMCIYNPDTLEFVEVNQAGVEHYGYSKDEFKGMKISDVFPQKDISGLRKVVQKLRGTNVQGKEWEQVKKDGSHINVIVSSSVVPYQGQDFRMIFVSNITEQKKLQQKLEQSEKKYRHLFENNPEPMWIYNPQTLEFVEVNQAAVEHYGYTEEEFLNMTLTDIRPTKDVEAMKHDVQQDQGKNSYSEEWTHLKSDGSEIDVELSAADVKYKNNIFRLVLINDITEQKKVQEKMIQSVIEGENRERKRIAHELHDGLGQYLVAANMNFESIKNSLDQLDHKRQNQFKIGVSLLKTALSETRSISYNLMPKAIADFGLATALENMVQDFRKSTDIEFQFDYNCPNLRLKDQAEINIYRTFQEITSNSIRHANCTKITMTLQLKEDSLNIMVSDNGVGTRLSDQQKESGLGLQGIKMRVNNLGGSLNIDTAPGQGMETVINIPNIKHLTTGGGSI